MACKDLGPDGGVVKVPGGGLLIAGGLAVPADGKSGFSAGCVFHHIDGAAGTMLYLNEGTVDSCAFKRLVTAARFSAVTTTPIAATGVDYTGSDTVAETAIRADLFACINQINAITLAISGL